jgi:DNA-binding CsgD family transcriptional regulator/PAS domain-containing protein
MDFDPRKLTGLLIDSVVDDAAFASLPQQLAQFAKATSCQVQFHFADGALSIAHHGISDQVLSQYNSFYWQHDVWATGYERLGYNNTITSDHFINEAEFTETEIYNDLYRSESDWRRAVGFGATLEGQGKLFVAAHRVASQGEFEPELVRHLNLLQAPMIHVVQARRRLEQGRGRLAEQALDAGLDAVVVADVRSGVVYANRAARALFATGGPFHLRSGHIASPDSDIAKPLSRAIAAACTGRGGRDLTLPPPFERFRVAIDPLDGVHSKLACVRIRDEATWAAHCAAAAQARHGFTVAETKLAQARLQGLTPTDYAAQRGVSLPTVRTQLRSLFDKAGVGGQAELVKRLGRM